MHNRTITSFGAVLLVATLVAGLSGQEPEPQTATDSTAPAAAGDNRSVVHGILFYSPTCPHCREVMTETLPPVLARYGERIRIATVNTMTPGGQAMYGAMVEHLALPRMRLGVPTLLVGSQALVGGFEIPNLLPAIADEALAADGIDWPDVPLIREALAAQGILARSGTAAGTDTVAEVDSRDRPVVAPEASPEPEVAEEPAPPRITPDPDAGPETDAVHRTPAAPGPTDPARAEAGPTDASADPERQGAAGEHTSPAGEHPAVERPADEEETPRGVEPVGPATQPDADELAAAFDTGAVAHELGPRDRFMLDPSGNAAAVGVLFFMLVALGLVVADGMGTIRIPRWPAWAVPVLSVVGAGVAAYLAYVETAGVEAICGPVGDCNTVQQSPYARLFGVVPVGWLGLVGYAVVVAAWALARGPERFRATGRTALWWIALGGTLFSVYLTFLEPFVIGASCAWCLTSAVLMALILLAATGGRRVGPRREAGRASASFRAGA